MDEFQGELFLRRRKCPGGGSSSGCTVCLANRPTPSPQQKRSTPPPPLPPLCLRRHTLLDTTFPSHTWAPRTYLYDWWVSWKWQPFTGFTEGASLRGKKTERGIASTLPHLVWLEINKIKIKNGSHRGVIVRGQACVHCNTFREISFEMVGVHHQPQDLAHHTQS